MNKEKFYKKMAKATNKVKKLIENQENALVEITPITIRYTDSEINIVDKK